MPLSMQQMRQYADILPQTEATTYEVAEFRGVSYRMYRAELRELRLKLLLLQEWIVEQDLRVAVVLEGRDAAGKGSTASGITHYLNPKSATIIEQGIPTPEQMRNWLGSHRKMMPEPGSMTIFDRSWYSRALVQPAMGFCTMRQYNYFLRHVNDWEKGLIDEGISLLKIYLSVSQEAQDLRFRLRRDSELQYWKYSATDRAMAERWHMLTYFKERMFAVTSTDYAPWVVIDSDNKHQARLNAIHFILSSFEYEGKDLSLQSLKVDGSSDELTSLIVDGVLFRNMDTDQVEVLERILIHE